MQVFRLSRRCSWCLRSSGVLRRVAGWLVPDLSREHSGILFKGRNLQGHKNKTGSDVDWQRMDLIQNSVVGSLGYRKVLRVLMRGAEVVMWWWIRRSPLEGGCDKLAWTGRTKHLEERPRWMEQLLSAGWDTMWHEHEWTQHRRDNPICLSPSSHHYWHW